MKFLHTSDWHLGAAISGIIRIGEQREILRVIAKAAIDENVDLIIAAGDIFDSPNPSAEAEALFYETLELLTKNTPVLIIAGNHDSPERLTASNPVTFGRGVISVGTLSTPILSGNCGAAEVKNTAPGCVELKIKGETAIILTMPFASERRLNRIFPCSELDSQLQSIFDGLAENFRNDTVNLIVSHIFVTGGNKTGDSHFEREIGGSFAADIDIFPPNAQYVALGHLHRPQKIGGTPVYYSGSPLQYSFNESGYSKSVNIVEVKPGQPAEVRQVLLPCLKPLEVWRTSSADEALEMCAQNSGRSCFVHIKISSGEVLGRAIINEMRSLKADIVEIETEYLLDEEFIPESSEKSFDENFAEFYRAKKGRDPLPELLDLLHEVLEEGK